MGRLVGASPCYSLAWQRALERSALFSAKHKGAKARVDLVNGNVHKENMADAAPGMQLQAYADIGILTVISEELDAAHRALPNLMRTKDSATGTIYWCGKVASELAKTSYQLVLACIGEPGNSKSAAAATELLVKFRPRVLFLVGIAGGMRGKVKIGEVIFSERIVAYEPAAIVTGANGSICTAARPDIDRAPHGIWQDVISYRPKARRLEEKFSGMQGAFPAPPSGKEEEYRNHVATAITTTQSTLASGEKLFRNAAAISAMRRDVHGKIEVVEMEAAGVVDAARRASTPWLVIRGISDFGDELKDDHFHTFAANAASTVLVDFIEHGLDLGPGSSPPGWQSVQRASEQWYEETRDVIGDNIRVARDKLVQRLVRSTLSKTVTVIVGDSGSGKSALVKAIRSSSVLSEPMVCLHAQEAATLVSTQGIDSVIRAKSDDRFILVLDGLDRLVSEEEFRAVARFLRAAGIESGASSVRVILTCQTAAWPRASQELVNNNLSPEHYEFVTIEHFDATEIRLIGEQVKVISPLLLRDELRPMMGRPKVLDLVARTAASIGLPDVSRWVGESNLIEWVWEKFIRADGRCDPHVRLLQHIAVRQADERAFSIPLVDLSSYDTTSIDALVRLGILVRRNDSVRFAHDLYADYARQRYLLSLFSSQRQQELRSRLTNPLWHRPIRLLGLHLLEHRDANGIPNIDDWRHFVQSLDERRSDDESGQPTDSDQERPGTGVDLLLEAIAFAAQPQVLLDQICTDLTANNGAMLRSLLFRFNHVARQSLRLRELFDPNSFDASAEARGELDQRIALPEYRIWAPLVEWVATHAQDVFEHAAAEFLDASEFWLFGTRAVFAEHTFKTRTGQLLAELVVGLVELYAAQDHYHLPRSLSAERRITLFSLVLLCSEHLPERVRPLIRLFAGLESPKEPRPKVARRSLIPPDYAPLEDVPESWPLGPKSEPNRDFRCAAFSRFGAEQLVKLDSNFACEVFLALLIEIPSEERYDGLHRDCYDFEATRLVSPPFWDFAPAQTLLSNDPKVGIDLVIKAVDFGVDRWMAHWPHVPREGTIFDELPTTPPSITLRLGAESHVYVGDSRVLDWHRGGSKEPDVAAALLMSLEHWLYEQNDRNALGDDTISGILSKTHSVAVLGVLFDFALRDPTKLLSQLEMMAQCPDLYIWSRHRIPNTDTAMIGWGGRSRDRIGLATEWHKLSHRRHDLLLVVSHIFVMSNFAWPGLAEARGSWLQTAEETSNVRLAEWIRDMMLPYTDRRNWRPTETEDGQAALEYVHPDAINQRQEAVRRVVEDRGLLRYIPLRCRRIIDGEEEVNEENLVALLEQSARSMDSWNEDDIWLVGGKWTPRCGVAAVALLKHQDWLRSNQSWEDLCTRWLMDACIEAPPEFRPSVDMGDISWDSFCADVIPQMWAASPENKELRRAVARLTATPHDVARKRLYANLAKTREAYPDDFSRLLHLSVWVARLSALDPGPLPDVADPEYISSSIKIVFLDLVDKFADRKLALLPGDWTSIANARPRGLKRNPYGEFSGLRDVVLVSAFGWLMAESFHYMEADDRDTLLMHVERLATVVSDRLRESYDEDEEWAQRRKDFPPRPGSNHDVASVAATAFPTPTTARNEARRESSGLTRIAKERIGAVREHARSLFRKRHSASRDTFTTPRRRPIGVPSETDYSIAELMAAYLVREPDPMARRAIWTRWLSLGNPYHRWISLLLDYIYVVASQIPQKHSHVAAAMRDMFNFALGEGGWLHGEGRQLHRTSDVARSLLGFGNVAGGVFWTVENGGVAVELRDCWASWAEKAISWYGCTEAFVRFLRKPGAYPLRPSCLQWIPSSETADWDSDALEALAALLAQIWSERAVLGHDLAGANRDHFDRLLSSLAARHVGVAVQLAVDIGRGEEA